MMAEKNYFLRLGFTSNKGFDDQTPKYLQIVENYLKLVGVKNFEIHAHVCESFWQQQNKPIHGFLIFGLI